MLASAQFALKYRRVCLGFLHFSPTVFTLSEQSSNPFFQLQPRTHQLRTTHIEYLNGHRVAWQHARDAVNFDESCASESPRCYLISFWIMSHGFLECGCVTNAELNDSGQWVAACQHYCMPLQSKNKRKALDAINQPREIPEGASQTLKISRVNMFIRSRMSNWFRQL